MKALHCDVVILGGGPAGLATALSLRKHNANLSVVVLERSAYQHTRVGETLPPGTQALLAQLDVWSAFVHRAYVPAYGTCAAWGGDQLYANEFIFGLHGRGWHVDRRDFDSLLAEETVKCGAAVYLNSRVIDHQRPARGWRLSVHGDSHFDLDADFVVDATGRSAWFARAQGARRQVFDRLAGAVMFFDAGTSADTYTLVEASEQGWWYSALLPGMQQVAAYMSDADLLKMHGLRSAVRWLECVAQTRHVRERLRDARPCSAPMVYTAHSQQLDRVTGEGWLAVGDAASTFDPLSSQGVFKALRGGIFAAYAILDAFKGDAGGLAKYAALIGQEFANYLGTWAAYYQLERRWPQSTFWQRRQEGLLFQ